MTDVSRARSAFQKYRKQRRKDGFIHKPDYRTAFYAGYLDAENSPLHEAARAVETWWIDEGMKHFDGAPYAIFALRSAISGTAQSSNQEAPE